jgi:UDP-glucose 4-epimerase
MILDAIDLLHTESLGMPAVVKILASGQGTTIASVLGYFRGLGKSAPNVMIATSPFSSLQAIDLRLRSTTLPELDRRSLTPLPVGIHATVQDILLGIQDRMLTPR